MQLKLNPLFAVTEREQQELLNLPEHAHDTKYTPVQTRTVNNIFYKYFGVHPLTADISTGLKKNRWPGGEAKKTVDVQREMLTVLSFVTNEYAEPQTAVAVFGMLSTLDRAFWPLLLMVFMLLDEEGEQVTEASGPQLDLVALIRQHHQLAALESGVKSLSQPLGEGDQARLNEHNESRPLSELYSSFSHAVETRLVALGFKKPIAPGAYDRMLERLGQGTTDAPDTEVALDAAIVAYVNPQPAETEA